MNDELLLQILSLSIDISHRVSVCDHMHMVSLFLVLVQL